jgi:hypothetical protein
MPRHHVAEHYEPLRKRYDLPSFELLDREFEISAIEKPDFLLRNIRRKVYDRLDAIVEFIDLLFQPDTGSLIDLHEYRCLSDADRREIWEILQKLMILYDQVLDADLACDDAADAAVIKAAARELPDLRKALRPFVQKLGQGWTRPPAAEEIQRYFG